MSIVYFFKDLLWMFLFFIGFIVVAGFFMVGGVYFEVATGGQKRKFVFLDQYISKRGYRFINPEIHEWIARLPVFEFAKKLNSDSLKSGPDGLSSIREFANGRRSGREAFALEIEGKETEIFAYTYTGNAGAPGNTKPYTIHLKVAKMHQDLGLSFRLDSKDIASRVLNVVHQILAATHTPGAPHYVEMIDHPHFSKLYYLTSNSEPDTKNFFSPQKILAFESRMLQGSLISERPYLVYVEHGKFTDEASYDEFIQSAKTAFERALST